MLLFKQFYLNLDGSKDNDCLSSISKTGNQTEKEQDSDPQRIVGVEIYAFSVALPNRSPRGV